YWREVNYNKDSTGCHEPRQKSGRDRTSDVTRVVEINRDVIGCREPTPQRAANTTDPCPHYQSRDCCDNPRGRSDAARDASPQSTAGAPGCCCSRVEKAGRVNPVRRAVVDVAVQVGIASAETERILTRPPPHLGIVVTHAVELQARLAVQ